MHDNLKKNNVFIIVSTRSLLVIFQSKFKIFSQYVSKLKSLHEICGAQNILKLYGNFFPNINLINTKDWSSKILIITN